MKNLSRYQHVMLDMETLSVADNPVVLSISAIAFDIAKINNLDDFKRPANGQIRDDISFHCALEMDDQIKRGLDYSNSTLLWHLNHNEKFFRECLGQKGSTIPILVPVAALEGYNEYIRALTAKDKHYRQPLVWACGAINDHRWLDSLYSAYQIKNVTGFRSKVCYRTIRDAFPGFGRDRVNNHDSFSDCVNQLITLQEIYNANVS